jgi:hypothetical protein
MVWRMPAFRVVHDRPATRAERFERVRVSGFPDVVKDEYHGFRGKELTQDFAALSFVLELFRAAEVPAWVVDGARDSQNTAAMGLYI